MAKSFKGQTAIVTGGARGIGLAAAQRLARNGVQIVLWDVSFKQFDEVKAGFTPLLKQTVDITKLDQVTKAFAEAEKASGGVDILVNNAGINGPVVEAWNYPLEEWDRVFDVNLKGLYLCCRVAAPAMKERGYGRIVNVASMAGKEPTPGIIAYSAAKAGVIGLTKTLGRELATSGVTVNAVAPAMTKTDLLDQMTPEHIAFSKSRIPMNELMEPDDIANLISFIASPECKFTTGFIFDASGGRAVY